MAIVPDDWRVGETWNAPTYLETNSAYWHNGHQSIRMEKGTDATKSREILDGNQNLNWVIYVKPGDHIVYSVWMKTNASTIGDKTASSGIRLGIDFYTNNGTQNQRIIGVQSPDGQFPTLMGGVLTFPSNQYLNYVNWGSDWQQRTMDFIVPNQYPSDGFGSFPAGQMVTPTQIVPWIQVWSDVNGNADNGIAWFADAILNINPTLTGKTVKVLDGTIDLNPCVGILQGDRMCFVTG